MKASGQSCTPFSDLEAFARKCIATERYPGDYHRFTLARCDSCGVVPMEPTVEHHTGSKPGSFKGVITGRCSVCGEQVRVFSFTSQQRSFLHDEKPACKCGSVLFLVAECERIEREDGLLGFFDEGVVVGKCAKCGRNQAFVYTD